MSATAGILATLLGCLGPGAAPALAQTLYTVSREDLELRVVDPTTGATMSQRTMVFDPNGPFAGSEGGAWAAATDPTTGRIWVVIQILANDTNRRLGSLDPNDPNAVVEDRGNLSDRFAGLAFDCAGNLYGVTDEVGSRGTVDETLYDKLQLCTSSSCAPVPRGALGHGDNGEAIAFDTPPVLYHASGRLNPFFERILDATGNLADPNNIEDIGFDGGADPNFPQASAMTLWRSEDLFLIAGQQNLFRISRSGSMTLVGELDHPVNGLAFTDQECGAGPTPTATATPTGPTPTRTATSTVTPTFFGTATPTGTPTFTQPPAGPYCSSASVDFPDNDPNGATAVLNIPYSSVLSDVDVILNVAHFNDGDLKVTLTKGATTISLLDRPRDPNNVLCTGNGVTTTMDDEAPLAAHTNCSSSPPTGLIEPAYRPFQALSVFNGMNLSGTWTLRISDLAANSSTGGTLSSWCLVTASGPTPTTSPTRTGTKTMTPTITPTRTATATPTATNPPGCVEQLEDGSFENFGTTSAGWTGGSTNFGGVIRCEGSTPCIPPIDEYGAQTGIYFGLFGGILADGQAEDSRGVRALKARGARATLPEIGFVEQSVNLNGGIGVLRFSLKPGFLSGNAADVFRALLDTTELFRYQGNGGQGQYRQILRNVGSFADGGQHTLRFEGSFTGRSSSPSGPAALSYFSLDDVSLCSAEPIPTGTPSRTATPTPPIVISAPGVARPMPLLLLTAGLLLSLRWLRRRAR